MKDDRVYLLHIRDAISRIAGYTTEGKDDFLEDAKTQDAVIRNLQIIGEAVKNLSGELRRGHADIPWKRIAGMRDKVIHAYFGIDLELVWDAIERDLPTLREKVDSILEEEPGAGT